MRRSILCSAFLLAANTHAAEAPSNIEITNAANARIMVLSVAPAGSEMPRRAVESNGKPISLEAGETVTISARKEGDCIRDLYATFADGGEWRLRALDICSSHSIHVDVRSEALTSLR